MAVARVGKRGMMVLPAEVRKRAGIVEGDEVLVEVDERGTVHLMKKPPDFVAALRNLHKDIWAGQDPVQYVREERQAWEKKPQA